MSVLREWISALSCACLVSGIIRVLAGGKSKTAVINLVTVLYILLSVLRPASAALKVETFVPKLIEPAETEVYGDLYQLAADEAAAQLEEEFAAACMQQGISARADLQLNTDRSSCTVETARIFVQNPENSNAVLRLAQNWFGEDALISVEEENS